MNTNQPAVYDPLTRALHWLTVAWLHRHSDHHCPVDNLRRGGMGGQPVRPAQIFRFPHADGDCIAHRVGGCQPRQASAKRQQGGSGRTRHSVSAHACRSRYRHDPPIRWRTRPLKVFGVEVMQGSPEKSSGWQTWATRSTAIWAGCCLPPSSDTSPWSSSIVFKAKTCCTA